MCIGMIRMRMHVVPALPQMVMRMHMCMRMRMPYGVMLLMGWSRRD